MSAVSGAFLGRAGRLGHERGSDDVWRQLNSHAMGADANTLAARVRAEWAEFDRNKTEIVNGGNRPRCAEPPNGFTNVQLYRAESLDRAEASAFAHFAGGRRTRLTATNRQPF